MAIFPALCYCVGRDSKAFGSQWVSSRLEGAVCVPLHVLVLAFTLLSVQGVFM